MGIVLCRFLFHCTSPRSALHGKLGGPGDFQSIERCSIDGWGEDGQLQQDGKLSEIDTHHPTLIETSLGSQPTKWILTHSLAALLCSRRQ